MGQASWVARLSSFEFKYQLGLINYLELVYKHPRNVSKRFQKDMSSRARCSTWVDLLPPPEGGQLKICWYRLGTGWLVWFSLRIIQSLSKTAFGNNIQTCAGLLSNFKCFSVYNSRVSLGWASTVIIEVYWVLVSGDGTIFFYVDGKKTYRY